MELVAALGLGSGAMPSIEDLIAVVLAPTMLVMAILTTPPLSITLAALGVVTLLYAQCIRAHRHRHPHQEQMHEDR